MLLNGQAIASTSWGGDPNDPDSSSFNYSTLAPEVVGLMEVYKTPEARIDEGSIGGTVIVNTRKTARPGAQHVHRHGNLWLQ